MLWEDGTKRARMLQSLIKELETDYRFIEMVLSGEIVLKSGEDLSDVLRHVTSDMKDTLKQAIHIFNNDKQDLSNEEKAYFKDRIRYFNEYITRIRDSL